MLKILRHKKTAKIIFGAILVPVIISFVWFGAGSLSGTKRKGVSCVGMIDGKKIGFDNLAMSIMSTRTQIVLNYFNQPEALKALLTNKPFMAKLAWDRLIMLSQARKEKIKSSDKEVIALIESHTMFNRNGAFDARIYEYVLKHNMGLSPRTFEETIRENLMIQKLNEGVVKDIKVSDDDIVDEYVMEFGRHRLSYVFMPLDTYRDKVKVDEVQVKEYYDIHQDEIMIQPKSPDDKTPARPATFDEAKENIKAYLIESEARGLAYRDAESTYKKIKDMVEAEKISFDEAAKNLGLAATATSFMAKTDRIEELGDAPMLPDAIKKLQRGSISRPIPTQKGVIIFTIAENEKMDVDINKIKADYSNKALEEKKNRVLEAWLRALQDNTTLNINFNDYDKYYQ